MPVPGYCSNRRHCGSSLLFPSLIEPYRHKKNKRRIGNARLDKTIIKDLAKFVLWVNTQCHQRGHAENIPADPRGPLTASRFRRTLAWFIRRRPRGLVAASIQYGHVHTRLIQGYAGTYESGFPDECAFEDWLFRIEGIAEDERALAAGERVSGPAADAYQYRVTAANMTCVLDPAQAACQLRGDIDDPMVTPDTDDCRPKLDRLQAILDTHDQNGRGRTT